MANGSVNDRLVFWGKFLGVVMAACAVVGTLWTFVARPQVKELIEAEMATEHDGLNVRNEPTLRAVAREEVARAMPLIREVAAEEAEEEAAEVWDRTKDSLDRIEVQQQRMEVSQERMDDKLDRLIELQLRGGGP